MAYIAILDLGSNSTRLSISEVLPGGQFKEVRREKQMTRMAENMGQGEVKTLQAPAIKRTLQALADYKAIYESYPDVTVRAIATAAVRVASNQADFLALVKDLTGVDVQVLTGDMEAYYDYVGARNALKLDNFVLCDMGGGSFELVVVKNGIAVDLTSIPYGAVSLTEKFHAQDLLSAQNLFKFQGFIQDLINEQLWLFEGRYLPLVLLGGANRVVARVEMKRRGQELEDFHGIRMSARSFLNIYTEWLGLNQAERATKLGVDGERADIILGGLTPIAQLISQLAIPELIFSESGVREGLLASSLTEE